MTVLVAVESPEGLWLGTDSFLGSEYSKVQNDGPKWYDRGPVRFLDSGSVRLSQVIKHAKPWRAPKKREDDESYLVNVVAGGVDKLVKELKLKEDAKCSAYLLAFRTRLWLLQSDRGVMRCVEGYAAEGAGYQYALGALAASASLRGAHGEPAGKARVRLALAAAERHCPQVAGPMHVELLPR